MKKRGFKEVVKNETKEVLPENFDFKAPSYDQRSSCYVNAGEKHGVGKKQPVGKESAGSKSAIPFGKVSTLETDEVA